MRTKRSSLRDKLRVLLTMMDDNKKNKRIMFVRESSGEIVKRSLKIAFDIYFIETWTRFSFRKIKLFKLQLNIYIN